MQRVFNMHILVEGSDTCIILTIWSISRESNFIYFPLIPNKRKMFLVVFVGF